MSLNDRPTDAQLNLIFRWFRWHMANTEASKAVKWLENNVTRGDVSKEIKRVHDLYYSHSLNRELCFSSSIWDGYNGKYLEEKE